MTSNEPAPAAGEIVIHAECGTICWLGKWRWSSPLLCHQCRVNFYVSLKDKFNDPASD